MTPPIRYHEVQKGGKLDDSVQQSCAPYEEKVADTYTTCMLTGILTIHFDYILFILQFPSITDFPKH